MSAARILGAPTGARHDHGHCVGHALAEAERACRQQGLRLTPIRRQVLELIWRDHQPVKAYDLIDALRDRGIKTGPPTVYRALDFLREAGLIHRLDTVNAFVGCGAHGRPHAGMFLICGSCGVVVELDAPDPLGLIGIEADRLGFELVTQAVEILGRCSDCREEGTAAGALSPVAREPDGAIDPGPA
ncbi:MAG TPA: Fur family transcriptional regulator [Candidatus Macondimonas sp.]|nr:Fur family transcriptional regulator [Candidatus Macondimonas sp.]